MAVLLQDDVVAEATEKLEEIIILCEMENLTDLKRAHQILKRTREVSRLLQVDLNFQLIPNLGLRIPDDSWGFVYACAQHVLGQVLTLQENREEVAQNLSQIHCAMETVRDYFLEQSSTSETTTSYPNSSQSTFTRRESRISTEMLMTVTIKHFLEGGGIISLSEQFHEVPAYSKLHDLGTKLLIENDLDVRDFDLLWDGDKKLENMNTRPMLRHFLQSVNLQPIPEVPEVCIFLRLRRTSLPRSVCLNRIYTPALEPLQPPFRIFKLPLLTVADLLLTSPVLGAHSALMTAGSTAGLIWLNHVHIMYRKLNNSRW